MHGLQVKSATRVIAVLEYFRLCRQPRTMSQISGDLGYPQSSATVLLKTLVTLGYLSFDRSSNVYFPTPKVTSLGDWVPRALFGAGQIIEAINDVHNATGEGIFLGTKNDVYLQYTKTRESIHALRFHIDEGTIRPITQSAAGWILLTKMSEERIDDIVRRANIAIQTPSERWKTKDILAKVAEIKVLGYARTENVPLKGGATIAVLLPAQIQGQPVTLALGGIAERVKSNFTEYLSALQSAARHVKAADEFDQPINLDQ
jgi:DNA-binding IclR family transcriptional regulator